MSRHFSQDVDFTHVICRDDAPEEIIVRCVVEVTLDEGYPGSASYPPGYYAEIKRVRMLDGRELDTRSEEDEEIKDIAIGIFKGE